MREERTNQSCSTQREVALEAGRLVGASLLLALGAVVVFLVPALTSIFELRSDAVVEGQWWRLLTGHWTHWSTSHLIWDVLMFAVLGLWLERLHRGVFFLTAMAGAIFISIGLAWLHPGITTYRGLSGVDSALFGALAVVLLRQALLDRDRFMVAFLFTAVSAFVLKTLLEIVFGIAIFVDETAVQFEPLVTSHLLGVVAGVVSALSLGGRSVATGRRAANRVRPRYHFRST